MSKRETKVKNQHYVSCFYLRAFARERTSPYHIIYIFDKIMNKTFPNNVTNSAVERYFYDIPEKWLSEPGADVQTVEKALGVYERYYQICHQRALGLKAGESLDLETASILGHMMLTQYARTVTMRKAAHENQMKILQEMVDDLMQRNFTPEECASANPRIQMDERTTGLLLCEMMLDGPSMDLKVKFLLGKFWTIWLNRTPNLFITSDNPVSMAVTSKGAVENGVAPLSPFGVEVAFPLSSRCVLTIGDVPLIRRRNREVLYADDQRIQEFNAMQVISSKRYLFGAMNDFQQATRMCEADPTLRSEARDQSMVATYREETKTTTISSWTPRHLKRY